MGITFKQENKSCTKKMSFKTSNTLNLHRNQPIANSEILLVQVLSPVLLGKHFLHYFLRNMQPFGGSPVSYTNGRLINPPPSGGRVPPLSRGGGVINLFLKSSDPSGACGGLFEKVNFPFNVFVKCPIK